MLISKWYLPVHIPVALMDEYAQYAVHRARRLPKTANSHIFSQKKDFLPRECALHIRIFLTAFLLTTFSKVAALYA